MPVTYDHPRQFTDGVRLIMRVSRRKDTADVNATKQVEVSRSTDEFLSILRIMQGALAPGERISAHVDARSENTARRLFQHRLVGAADQSDQFDFYHTCHKHWISCLGQEASRLTKRFLYDIDDPSLHQLALQQLNEAGAVILDSYGTKSGGSHIITEPFDPSLVRSSAIAAVRHTNAMMLWAYKP